MNPTYENGDGCVHRELVFRDGDMVNGGKWSTRIWSGIPVISI